MSVYLNEKELKFVQKWLEHRNSSVAYIEAGYKVSKIKPTTVAARGATLLGKDKIQRAIADAMRPQLEQAGFGVREILRELVDVITADPGELMQHRRVACRHCHSKGHKYHWKNKAEYAQELAVIIEENARRELKNLQPKEFPDDDGGYGFNPTVAPHPQCPECYGEGKTVVYYADTRYLSPKARRLFAGVKLKKEGMEIVTKDQQAALRDLMRLIGADKQVLVHMNPDGTPIEPGKQNVNVAVVVPDDPAAAARLYADFMRTIPGKK